ncbi:MAG: hypothetical protein JSW50_16700 [Candidatus Latescibacterota bacterium]|nr:MAG: hypothetical protein JSW50_16700 [Candidatus Latescibacterota bacterium]
MTRRRSIIGPLTANPRRLKAGTGNTSFAGSPAAPVWLIVLLGVLFVIFLSSPVGSQSVGQEFIPPENWAYRALDRFEVLGLVVLPAEKPFLRDEIVRFVNQIKRGVDSTGVALDVRDQFNLDRLEKEFSNTESMENPKERWDRPVFFFTEDQFSLEGDIDVGILPGKPAFDSRWWVFGISNLSGKLNFGKWVTYDFRYRLVYGPERDDREHKKKPTPRTRSWNGLTSLYERSYVVFRWRRLALFWGRDYADYGPTDRGNLILSTTAQSLDKLGGRLGFKKLRFSFLHANLYFDPQRTFSAHRLEFDLRRFTFGLAETALYTGRGIDPIYTLPLSSFYANQFNERKDDNLLWSIDMKYRMLTGVMLYGSLLIDDFQFERDGTNPDKLGFDVGGRFALRAPLPVTMRFNYRYVDIYTYTHRDSLKYHVTGRGDPIGNETIPADPPLGALLGPDGDIVRFDADLFPRPEVTTSLRLAYRRRGEGNDWRRFEEGVDDPSPPFPSGVVEQTFRVEIGVKWELDGNSVAGFDAGWAWVQNQYNEPGVNRDDPLVRLFASWDF